tara:strand:- start:47 stop:565 length:519 start_codon:yes stop_codon:yes gene_type:complete
MGKRSDFERRERDFYPTPYAAVLPLLPHLDSYVRFDEPCAGNAALVDILESTGRLCSSMSDIEPQMSQIERKDVFDIKKCVGDTFITNPPWDRNILHPLITHLSSIAPTWLLFDADWMHTKQSIPLIGRCQKIISIGRVKWIPNSKMTGKDNCAWHFFTDKNTDSVEFHGRV